MIVWRIEDRAGVGPCYEREGRIVGDLITDNHPRHDGAKPKEEYLYGFDTRQQYTEWFCRDERRSLREAGFHLVRYDVPDDDVYPGNRQVVFTKTRARCLSEWPVV